MQIWKLETGNRGCQFPVFSIRQASRCYFPNASKLATGYSRRTSFPRKRESIGIASWMCGCRNKSFPRKRESIVFYCKSFAWPQEAIQREKRLKKWNRAWKIQLIESTNPRMEGFV
jgi:hypothetical protein